jgi:hypothetical protein
VSEAPDERCEQLHRVPVAAVPVGEVTVRQRFGEPFGVTGLQPEEVVLGEEEDAAQLVLGRTGGEEVPGDGDHVVGRAVGETELAVDRRGDPSGSRHVDTAEGRLPQEVPRPPVAGRRDGHLVEATSDAVDDLVVRHGHRLPPRLGRLHGRQHPTPEGNARDLRPSVAPIACRRFGPWSCRS